MNTAAGPVNAPLRELCVPSERARIVRLCHRLTGDAAAAEDLAQETLLVAWRQAEQGWGPREWRPYLAGIARKLCLNWRSQRARRAEADLTGTDVDAHATDPLGSLIQSERDEVLDRALALLDAPTRSLLTSYYVRALPLADIGDALGLTENAAAARLHRAREALRRVLAGDGGLREAAVAHGLLTADAAAGWGDTRLWCPRCGRARLRGRFAVDAATGRYDYALRCPDCDGAGTPAPGFTSDAAPMNGASVLAGVQGYRAAFKRLHRWWEGYVREGLANGTADCIRCGRATAVRTATRRPDGASAPGLFTRCDACQGVFFIAVGGLLFHSAAMRDFWQAHPRAHFLPERRVRCEGREALLVGFADRQGGARLETAFALDDLRPLRVLITK